MSLFISVMKAIGIVLIVAGHVSWKNNNILFLFHVALFFFISGYLFKVYDPIVFLRKKALSLWLPFVAFNTVIISFRNFFVAQGLYTPEYIPFTSFTAFADLIYKVMKLQYMEAYLFTLWFVIALFFSNLIFYAILKGTQLLFKEKYLSVAGVCSLLVFGVGFYQIKHNIQLDWYLTQALIAVLIMYLGYLYKIYEKMIPIRSDLFVLSLVMLVLNSKFGNIDMLQKTYTDPSFFLISSLAGIYLVIYVSYKSLFFLNKFPVLVKMVNLLSDGTFYIMALQFLGFLIIALIQTQVYALPITKIHQPSPLAMNSVWTLLNIISGLLFPLIIYKMVATLKKLLSFLVGSNHKV